MIILSFDTGHNFGWSIVDNENLKMLQTGFEKIPAKISIESLCGQTAIYTRNVLVLNSFEKILIELPEYFNSKKGKISIKSGKLFQTYASAITIYNCCINYISDVRFIKPSEWKGQMNKKATQERIKLILGDHKLKNEHILDSVGMSLSQNKKVWNLLKRIT